MHSQRTTSTTPHRPSEHLPTQIGCEEENLPSGAQTEEPQTRQPPTGADPAIGPANPARMAAPPHAPNPSLLTPSCPKSCLAEDYNTSRRSPQPPAANVRSRQMLVGRNLHSGMPHFCNTLELSAAFRV